jgi:mannan endo-1,4-beta-mannosidase
MTDRPDQRAQTLPAHWKEHGMTPPDPERAVECASHRRARIKKYAGVLVCAAIIVGAATTAIIQPWTPDSVQPTRSVRYLGVYEPDAPETTAGVDQFTRVTGKQPNLVSYYSPWLEAFQRGFATSMASRGAETVVQIDPKNVSLASIANGQYDRYLRSYAAEVKAFGRQVVLSFGHEMNGDWYSWGYHNTPSAVFVGAWRRVVSVFRSAGASNAIWLWTVNIIDKNVPIPNPSRWWPGKSYVNWVGIDGYYYTSSQTFAQVFGPTIVDVRELTKAPILIAETGASLAAGQQAKINDLFAGVESYGLLGFMWFDANSTNPSDGEPLHWRISNPVALAAFGQDAREFMRPTATPSPGRSSP